MTDTETPTEPTPISPRRRGPRRGARRPSTRSPRRAASSNGLVAGLRSQLAEQVKPCEHCGSPGGNKSEMARQIGISVMSLNKFLKGGRVNSDTVDAVHGYLNRSE